MSRFSQNKFMSIMSDKRRMKGMSKKKRKREKFFADITKDGKIKKKEAQELLKRGYSERDLQRYDTKAFGRAQDAAKNRQSRDRGYSSYNPTYSPLLISRGAGNVFGAGMNQRPQQAAPAPAPAAPEPTAPSTPPTLDVQGFPDPPAPDTSAADALAAQIAEMQAGFMQSMQQQQAMYQQMQASQSERMEALQQQMLQAQVAQQDRPQVAGVQMASSAAGTPMQIARRGVSGAFGRRGMRISSLNV
jgi:hypothetical protein